MNAWSVEVCIDDEVIIGTRRALCVGATRRGFASPR